MNLYTCGRVVFKYTYIYTLVQQCLAQIYNGIGQSVAQRGYRVGGEKRELSTDQRVNWIDCNIVKNRAPNKKPRTTTQTWITTSVTNDLIKFFIWLKLLRGVKLLRDWIPAITLQCHWTGRYGWSICLFKFDQNARFLSLEFYIKTQTHTNSKWIDCWQHANHAYSVPKLVVRGVLYVYIIRRLPYLSEPLLISRTHQRRQIHQYQSTLP